MVSDYSVFDVGSLNWDIALMLTPWGFIQNLWLTDGHYLATYYHQVSERGHLLSRPILLIAILIHSGLALWAIRSIRKS